MDAEVVPQSIALPITAIAILCVWSSAQESAPEPVLAHEFASEPYPAPELLHVSVPVPELPVCPDKITEVILELPVCLKTTTEVVPELIVTAGLHS